MPLRAVGLKGFYPRGEHCPSTRIRNLHPCNYMSVGCGVYSTSLLGGSWDLISKVISTLSGVISVVTLIITLVTKSHDPLSS